MRCSFMRSPCFCLNQGVRRRDIALEIKAVSEKLDEIAKEKAMYGFELYKAADHELPRLSSTSLVDESSVCGRHDEKKIIISKLLAETSQEARNVDVISLVGLGGIGKTTLAQLAFNDAEVTAHFEKKIWVCVSEPFDEVRIAKAILEQLEGSTPNLAELQSLLPRVSRSINGKRVLLVLDDVWTEDHGQWEQLKPSLASCARGSRILVTTRKGAVAAMMGTDHQIDIETLSDDACRSIFNHVAFHERSKDEREKLTDIGNKIANKCKGLPLAAKVLGVDGNNLGEATVETSIARVRHLSMMLSRETSFPSSIHRAKGLRSLLIGSSRDPWLGAALPDAIKQLTCIRSLDLSWSSIKEIPKEVGKLIHLRQLNLGCCRKLVSLPETMCDLCNLQSLDVSGCWSLKELPVAIVKLIKLRHLYCFIVCGGDENESKAANLRELKNLDDIGGRLVIENLRGGDIEDAAEAQLKNKKRLLCLELNFCKGVENRLGGIEDGILIEGLQPPSDLERLTIDNYGGIVLPNWMMALTRLQELELRHCGNLEVLPPLGRLPNLESLSLYRVGVRRLDAGFLGIEEVENANNINEGEIARVIAFPKLKILVIFNLSELEEWDGIERGAGEEDATTTSIFIIMPQLQQLEIVYCRLLRALPDYVLAAPLQVLCIRDCPNLRKRYGKEEKGEDWHKISHIPHVFILEVNIILFFFFLNVPVFLSHTLAFSVFPLCVFKQSTMGDSQYSFSLITFSPTGKLVQIEHALTSVKSGQTSLGIKAANGVVVATEKKLPSILVDESSVLEWVLTFEFWYGKVGSKQNNIIDCTRVLTPAEIDDYLAEGIDIVFLAQVEFFPVLTPIEILFSLFSMETSASNVELQLHQHFISYSLSNATANAVLAERNIKDHCQKSQSVFTSTVMFVRSAMPLMRSSGIEKKINSEGKQYHLKLVTWYVP
ncbi:hypothetical protein DKX38_018948 [Salix brachista]|uniref:Proteasome alpha-type subunits domain-containing protein n=1 Tax=Salix brachista TaxID=2182728 RepID=A0A5N5KQ65_9ROSI|nr:hypothetical protein DKX38_018948 [Salix brachista]